MRGRREGEKPKQSSRSRIVRGSFCDVICCKMRNEEGGREAGRYWRRKVRKISKVRCGGDEKRINLEFNTIHSKDQWVV